MLEEEWVVYRLRDGRLNAVPRVNMENYLRLHKKVWGDMVDEVVAERLTEAQAKQFRDLTKESE
jgi:hypothetical protein